MLGTTSEIIGLGGIWLIAVEIFDIMVFSKMAAFSSVLKEFMQNSAKIKSS